MCDILSVSYVWCSVCWIGGMICLCDMCHVLSVWYVWCSICVNCVIFSLCDRCDNVMVCLCDGFFITCDSSTQDALHSFLLQEWMKSPKHSSKHRLLSLLCLPTTLACMLITRLLSKMNIVPSFLILADWHFPQLVPVWVFLKQDHDPGGAVLKLLSAQLVSAVLRVCRQESHLQSRIALDCLKFWFLTFYCVLCIASWLSILWGIYLAL